jgi:hypothetical protein
MTKNCGPEDRVVRIVVAIGLAILIFVGVLDDTAAIIAGIIAAYLLVTGLAARCLIYKAAGLDTSVQEQPYSTTDDRSGL